MKKYLIICCFFLTSCIFSMHKGSSGTRGRSIDNKKFAPESIDQVKQAVGQVHESHATNYDQCNKPLTLEEAYDHYKILLKTCKK